MVRGSGPLQFGNGTFDSDCEKLFWTIEASSWEEAMAIYNLRQGFDPYIPVGKASECPYCGEMFYPDGSGKCWNCGVESPGVRP